jgi:uncharacterized protein YkuJ
MRDSGVDIRTENIFDNEYTTLKDEVASFIKEDGVTIILCDGGNKINEFNLLSNFMKEGDFILAHDYSENREVFEEKIYKKIWNWHEISDSDLVESCEKNNLVEYDKEIFDNVVWVCKIKK